jgi:uncharacterized protein YjdB
MTVAVIALAITGCSDDIDSGQTPQPDSVTVTPTSVDLAIGETQYAAATFKVGNTVEANAIAVWTTSDPNVVAVSTSGQNASLIGMAGGTATVTVSDGPVSASVKVTVAAAVPSRLDIAPTPVAVPLGGIVPIHVGAVYPNGTEIEITDQVTWTTDADTIATVAGSQVTGVALGTANLTASFGGQTATVAVTVGAPVPHSITISSASPTFTVAVGSTINFGATEKLTDGTASDVTTTSTWTSATPANATIGANTGVATGVKAGTTLITVVLGALTTNVTLTVTAAP